MVVELVHSYSGEVVSFSCLNWEVSNYQFYFYSDKEGKIIESCFSTRNWDVRKISYD
jgi:hypothetical protein